MSRLPKFLFLLALISFFIFIPGKVLAKNISTSIFPKTETYAGDYIKAGETVTLSGTVEGDAYLAGGTILIDGVVKGDLLAIGGTVTVTGEVGQNIRIVGGSININGWVGKNTSLVGGNVHIDKNTTMGGNLTGFFGNLEYLGGKVGNMVFAAGNANLNGKIEGNVDSTVSNLALGDNLNLTGNLTYTGKNEASLAPNAVVSGITNYKQAETGPFYSQTDKNKLEKFQQGMKGFQRGFSFLSFVVAAVLGYLFLRLFPRRTAALINIYTKRPLRSIVLGLLTLLIVPAVSLLFAVTIIGLPVSLLIMILLAIIVYFAKIVIALYFGRIILNKIGFGERRGWALLLGLLTYFILGGLPFMIGALLKLLVLFAGTGAIVTDIYRLYRSPSLRKIL